MKAFICVVEMYDGKKQPMRVFAESREEARKKLIKQFPRCYISEAMTTKEYDIEKNSRNSKDDDIKMTNEVEQAFRQGYVQAKKETAQALEKLIEKIDQAYGDAVDDARHYWSPNTAEDALQDAYDNVERWINEIFNDNEEAQNENDKGN